MAPPSTSSSEPALPRRTLRSALLTGSLALLPLCLVGLVAAWQNVPPRHVAKAGAPTPAAAVATATTPVNAPPHSATSEVEPVPMAPETTPPPLALEDPPESAASAAAPQAGRQVMRCIEHGRVAYRDLQSACPEGTGQAVTVFPTRGVEKFKAGP